MAYELMAILLAIETFKDKCQNANVRVWTDNIGGECAFRNQSSKSVDHNALVHLVWLCVAKINAGLWIERVPSALNLADGPTRPTEEIGTSILKELGARPVEPQLPSELLSCNEMADIS